LFLVIVSKKQNKKAR